MIKTNHETKGEKELNLPEQCQELISSLPRGRQHLPTLHLAPEIAV